MFFMNKERVNILLLEDILEHVELFRAHLELSSYADAKVEHNDSLQQGVELLKTKAFDILFVDLSLSDSDINNTMGMLLKLRDFCPVVVITSLDDHRTLLEIIEKGADDCLPKSELDSFTLERCIKYNLSRRNDKLKLQQHDQYLLDIIKNLPQGVLVLDQDMKIQAYNALLFDILALEKTHYPLGSSFDDVLADWIKQSDFSLTISDLDDELLLEVEKEELQRQDDFQKEFAFRVNHQEKWCELTQTRLANGSIIRTYVDISDKKHADEHLMLMQFAFENLNEAAFLIKQDGRFEYVNDSASKQLGFSKSELLTMDVAELHSHFSHTDWLKIWGRMKAEGASIFETEHCAKDGHCFPVEIAASYIEYKGDGHILAFAKNITERQNAQKQLSLLASVFASAFEGMIITDLNNRIINVNTAFSQITGYSKEEVLGRSPGFLNSSKHEPGFYKKIKQDVEKNGYWRGELSNRKKSGELFTELLTITTILDEHGMPSQYLEIFSDISLQKKQEQALQNIAHYDSLTNLPNRLLFSDRLQVAIAQTNRKKEMMAIAYMDLDGFKAVNDSLGHKAGDDLLQEIAFRMKQQLREGDTVARFGGDEFVAIFANLSKADDVVQLLDRVIKSVAQPIVLNEGKARVSTSIGVTFYPQEQSIEVDQLLRQADQAMYQAKTTGKNQYVIFDNKDT